MRKWTGYFYFVLVVVMCKHQKKGKSLKRRIWGNLHYKSITRNKSKKENNIKILLISSISLLIHRVKILMII